MAEYVEAVIQERFGDRGGIAAVPNHSRYRHFEPGGVDRLAQVIYLREERCTILRPFFGLCCPFIHPPNRTPPN